MLTADEMKALAEMLPGVDVNDEEIIKAFRELAKIEKPDNGDPNSGEDRGNQGSG